MKSRSFGLEIGLFPVRFTFHLVLLDGISVGMLVNANCFMQNISCCPDVMSVNIKKTTFHEYLPVFHKGKSSCRMEEELCMFVFTIQLATISATINYFIMEAARKKAVDYFKHWYYLSHVVGVFFWFQFLNDLLGVSLSEFMPLLPFVHYYSWSVSCFWCSIMLGLLLAGVAVSRFIFCINFVLLLLLFPFILFPV